MQILEHDFQLYLIRVKDLADLLTDLKKRTSEGLAEWCCDCYKATSKAYSGKSSKHTTSAMEDAIDSTRLCAWLDSALASKRLMLNVLSDMVSGRRGVSTARVPSATAASEDEDRIFIPMITDRLHQ